MTKQTSKSREKFWNVKRIKMILLPKIEKVTVKTGKRQIGTQQLQNKL